MGFPIKYFTINRAKIWLFFVIVLNCLSSYAQREAENWLFGRGQTTHLNFANTDPTVSTLPAVIGFGGAACMSNRNGNLLFYSGGFVVNNRLNEIMEGVSLLNPLIGNDQSGDGGSTGIITVPYPGHDSLYYLFYIESKFVYNHVPRLRCALINMNGDNGLGKVVMKDSLLLNGDSVCKRITAVRHCNKKDVWIIGHLSGSDKYFAYLVTASGISAAPVLSPANYLSGLYTKLGYMKASPIGDKLVSTYRDDPINEIPGNVELADFNNQTGQVSNVKILQTKPAWALLNSVGPCGVEFSPSGNKLYVASNYTATEISTGNDYNWGHIFQFDISSNDQAVMQASRYMIDSIKVTLLGGAQLAPNGKIYISDAYQPRLNSIDSPEGNQAFCNYTRNSIIVPDHLMGNDLPSFIQSYLRYPVIATGNCQFQNISFSIENLVGVSSVHWDFGDPLSGVNNSSTSLTPTHIYTSEGAYNVKIVLQNSNGCGADTVYKQIHAGRFAVFLGNDTTICANDTLKLKMKLPFANNLWSDNSTDTVLNITQPGTYWVKVNIGECSTTDTIVVSFRSLPEFTLGNDTIICNNQSVLLSPHPDYPGVTYLWNTNSTSSGLSVNAAGDYWLQMKDNIGCKWKDTLNLSFKTLPGYSLGRDSSICEKDTLELNATTIAVTGYLWNTGSLSPIIKVFRQDYYWCDVSKDGCIYRDSIYVTVKPLPVIQLGNDTTICEDKTHLLIATNPGSDYLWQDNNVSNTYLVNQAGKYFVKVTMNKCVSKDTINVSYKLKPRFTLGGDQLICSGQPIILKPLLDNSWQLLWQDGTIQHTFSVFQSGFYNLVASNECGSTKDEVIFKEGICAVNVPGAFTPNNDGNNDFLKALGTEIVTDFHFWVYNRYGKLVFETNNKERGWDGTVKGEPQSNGSYVWILSYKDSNNKIGKLKGSSLLIR